MTDNSKLTQLDTQTSKGIQKDLAQSFDWAHSPQAAPEYVRNVLLSLEEAQLKGKKDDQKGKRALNALAREMGFISSSEKAPKTKIPKNSSLDLSDLDSLLLKEKEISALARYVARRHKNIQHRIKDLYKRPKDLTSETAEKSQNPEPVLGGSPAGYTEQVCEHIVPEESAKKAMGPGTLIETQFTRTKNDLILCRRDPVLILTKLYNPTTGITVYPDTHLVGPKGFQITWRALTNIISLSFGMALPLSRIEKLFGSKGFSRANTAGYCAYVAQRLVEVYVAMSQELAHCDVLMGDDCVSRVSDLNRYRKNWNNWQKEKKKQPYPEDWIKENPEPLKPWESLRPDSLTKQLEKELDFEFAFLKADKKSLKTQLHTTVLSGETQVGNPRSRVILYRSHLGSVGNLLDRLLLSRSLTKKELVFVGDLSPTHHVSDPNVLKHIRITYAGCTSHARRPFHRYSEQDPENCLDILDHFRALYHIEEIIAEHYGSHKAAIRKDVVNGSLSFWQDIKKLCESMLNAWSPATALGEGIRYVISHFEQLTLYCKDARIPLANDLSERLLRYEKLMDRSSFGRETVEGRARYDIIRSFYQSSLYAGLDPTFALLDVLITPAHIVSAAPKKYTPQAISLRLKENPERMSLLNTILTTSLFKPLITFTHSDPNLPIDDSQI